MKRLNVMQRNEDEIKKKRELIREWIMQIVNE